MTDAMHIILHTGRLWFDMCKKKSPVQYEHYAHTAPDNPSSTALSIFFFLPHFLLMQLLFFLLVLF